MEAFTLATCGAICPATFVEECAQCVQECVRASHWNLSHSDTCHHTFIHVLNIDDAGHADFVGAHVSERVHTGTHVRRQIARRFERCAFIV